MNLIHWILVPSLPVFILSLPTFIPLAIRAFPTFPTLWFTPPNKLLVFTINFLSTPDLRLRKMGNMAPLENSPSNY